MPMSIHAAAQNNQPALVEALAEENPKLVSSVDDDGRTPLHWAAFSGSTEIASYLIAKNSEVVDKVDQSGWTALHIGVSAGHEDIVRELAGAGADINKKNDKGITPLHYAASKSVGGSGRYERIGKFLIERGADINAKDKANQTPLHRAATTGSTGFVSLLLNPPEGSTTAKLRLNTGDRMGNTPLHLAMESAHAQVAVMLIEAGADRGRTNLDGATPENVEGVGGTEQTRAKHYVIVQCDEP